MDQHAVDNSSSSSPVSSVGSITACLSACPPAFTPVTVLSLSMWDLTRTETFVPRVLRACPSLAGLGTWRRKGDPDLHCGTRAAGGLQGHSCCCKSGKSGKQRPGTVRRGTARYGPHHATCGPE